MFTGFKTAAFAAALAVVGALQGLDWLSLIPSNPQLVGWITTGLGAIVFILRALTNTSIGSKS